MTKIKYIYLIYVNQRNKYFSNLTVTDNIRVGTQLSFGNNKGFIDLSGNDLILRMVMLLNIKNMVTSGLQSNLLSIHLYYLAIPMNNYTGFPVTCDIAGNSMINGIFERIKVTLLIILDINIFLMVKALNYMVLILCVVKHMFLIYPMPQLMDTNFHLCNS